MRRLLTLVVVLVALGGLSAAGSHDHPAIAAGHAERVARQCPGDLAPGTGTGAHVGAADRCGVVVVGIGGLRWADVGPDTPTLARLARTAALGALSVKALPEVTCPADGWLTLGAGARAGASDGPPCDGSLAPDPRDVRRNADSRDGARLGALADALGGQVDARGNGAALAAGVASTRPAPLLLVDGGTLGADRADRAVGLRVADAVVARALAERPGADLLVVGLSEGVGGDEAHLHVALAAGPSFPRGALVSASTRRAPYVQLIDVAPTVLSLLDVAAPNVMDGQPWRVDGPVPSVSELADLDRRARAQREATVPFFVAVYAAVLGLLLLAAWRRWWGTVELVALAGTAVLGASYLANLLPWWRAGLPLLALLAIVVPMSVAVALLARPTSAVIFRGWRPTRRTELPDAEDQRSSVAVLGAAGRGAEAARPAGLVCGFVAVVILGDLLTGAHLQLGSVAGYSALVAGRFAGIGNVAFGVLAASILLATAVLTRRAAVVAAVGAVAVVVDGAPPWGSDVGGVLALVPAFALLAMLRSGRSVSIFRLGLAGLLGAAVVAVLALADWSRDPADRTHLGRFVQDVADGTAGELLRRKAEAVLGLLLDNAVTALLPLLVAGLVYLVVRPPGSLRHAFEVAPGWRHGLLALGLASLLGFALNDSGAAVPALAAAVALPATVAVATRARRCPAPAPRE